MAKVERIIERLKELRFTESEKALAPAPTLQNEYGYGYVCGIQEGLRLAQDAIESLNRDVEEEGDGRTRAVHARTSR